VGVNTSSPKRQKVVTGSGSTYAMNRGRGGEKKKKGEASLLNKKEGKGARITGNHFSRLTKGWERRKIATEEQRGRAAGASKNEN